VQNAPRNNVSPHDPYSNIELQEGGMQGGARMNIFFNDYSEKYSQYLKPFRHSKKTIHLPLVVKADGKKLVWPYGMSILII
jgi:hypothetical protein